LIGIGLILLYFFLPNEYLFNLLIRKHGIGDLSPSFYCYTTPPQSWKNNFLFECYQQMKKTGGPLYPDDISWTWWLSENSTQALLTGMQFLVMITVSHLIANHLVRINLPKSLITLFRKHDRDGFNPTASENTLTRPSASLTSPFREWFSRSQTRALDAAMDHTN
jgi:hypothetical protein